MIIDDNNNNGNNRDNHGNENNNGNIRRSDNNGNTNDNSNTVGAIVGGIVASLLIFVVIWCVHRNRLCIREQQTPVTNPNNMTNSANKKHPSFKIQTPQDNDDNIHNPIVTNNLQVFSLVQNSPVAIQPTEYANIPCREGGEREDPQNKANTTGKDFGCCCCCLLSE